MKNYTEQLKEVEMLIQKEKLHPSKKSEEVLNRLYAKRKQLIKLTEII